MMNVKAFQSIAVVGQVQTGKRAICSLLGEKLAVQTHGPLRYKITLQDFPGLKGYVLTIYSKLDHLNLDMSEKTGIIVLNPDKITSLCSEQRFKRHQRFFEMLGRLCWLGVERYILVVNHTHDLKPNDIDWFEDMSQKFSRMLEKDLFCCHLKVEACVPVGQKDKHHWYNIRQREPWYAGPSLAQALENLAVIFDQPSYPLWAVGTAIPTDKDTVFWLRTEKPARGLFCENTPVRIFLDNVDASEGFHGVLRVDRRTEKENSVILSVKLQNGMLYQTSSVVVVSNAAPVRSPRVIRIDALLNGGVTLDQLYAMDLDLKFFGPHSRGGQILNSPKPLDDPYFDPSLGQRTYLEIHALGKPVIEPFVKDAEAGRVLIYQKDHTGLSGNLIGVGRIMSFFDYEMKDLINQLMQVDQLQFTLYQEQDDDPPQLVFWTQELERLIHDMKRDVEMLQIWGNVKTSDYVQRMHEFDEGFEYIIANIKSLRTCSPFAKYTSLINVVITHLDEVKGNLLKSFQEFADKTEVDRIDTNVSHIARKYDELKRLINRRTTQPVRKLIREIMGFFEEKGIHFLYAIHDHLPQDVDHYPKEIPRAAYQEMERETPIYSIQETIKDALAELTHNSVKYYDVAGIGQDLRIDIFIDPPSVEKPSQVNVWFQDNGALTEKTFDHIQNSKQGWHHHRKHLEHYNIELDVSDRIGFGTTCCLSIPIWLSQPDTLQNIVTLTTALQYIDRIRQRQTGICPDYLNRLSNTLHFPQEESMLATKIQELRAASEQSIRLLPALPVWAKNGIAQFDGLVSVLHSRSDRHIKQVKRLLRHLQQHAVPHILQDVRNEIWKYMQKDIYSFRKSFTKEELMHITLSDVPDYRLLYPSMYFTLRDTLIWGLKECMLDDGDCRSVLVEYRMSDNRETIELLLSGAGIHSSGKALFPFRTRLANLGINNEMVGNTEDMLVLSIPIWIVKKEKR